ncbi:MAG TPA: ABC transporter substrate-binding protein, partial [Thermoleophilaceae bacterium]|nr:ABC transporter substrate-binding protein [Thermoleophilaceae bacterium]
MALKTAATALACALTVLVAACGSDSGSSGGDADSGTTITHKFGTTKVPENPKRIVTLGYNDHEFLLAMGVEPVAIRDWVGVGPVTKVPWAKDEIAAMKKKPTLIPRTDLKPEQVAKLKPDLIIGVFG